MSGEDVSIIGLGASGAAAARLALEKGETVYVSDIAPDARSATPSRARVRARELEELGAHVDLGSHDVERIQASRLVVVSPGIPPDAPVLRELRARGVRWISEPELAVRFYQGPLIAVTGTNGKTTTAALIAHLLESSGIEAALGGNVGAGIAPPASELALREPPPAWYVLEMSSFQLADTETFSPEIGAVTNLAPDHLDRYPDTAAYYADKARLFRNASESSRWVLNGESPETLALPGEAPGRRYLFAFDPSGQAPPGGAPSHAFVRDGVLTLRVGDRDGEPGGDERPEEALIARDELLLLGRHNVLNALAAALVARLAGAGSEGIRTGLRSFRPLPHRLEPVAEVAGVLWVNDSKATNVAAAAGAVTSLERPLVVLLGGRDKGEDFRPLGAALRGRARAAVLYGEAAMRLEEALSVALSESAATSEPRPESMEGSPAGPAIVRVDEGFDAAVGVARSLAREGDAVLLAPACSSFDLFESYVARGRRFSELAAAGEER